MSTGTRRMSRSAARCGLPQGHSGSPYYQLGAIAGIAYILFVVVLRWRPSARLSRTAGRPAMVSRGR